jgi:acetyl-CoA carboxylase beta subunit
MAEAETNPGAEDKKETPTGEHFVRCRHCSKLIDKADLIDAGTVKLCPSCRLAMDEAYYA